MSDTAGKFTLPFAPVNDVREQVGYEVGYRHGIMAGLAHALSIVDEKAHDYEGDWSSPEFNYAMGVGKAIEELIPNCPPYHKRMVGR